jgi:hypothetical protein
VHRRLSGLPDTSRVRSAWDASEIVMVAALAVNGPTEMGGDGMAMSRPPVGTGLGMGVSNGSVGVSSWVGVAPVASRVAVAEPLITVFPNAAAASTIDDGMLNCVW